MSDSHSKVDNLPETSGDEKSGHGKKQSRSFTIFFVLVICVMTITGWLAMMDIWYGEVLEQTVTDEKRTLKLSENLQVNLGSSSELTFHKSSQHEFILSGYADVEIDDAPTTVAFETKDLVAEATNAHFWIECTDSTHLQIRSGKVLVHLKAGSMGTISLTTGDHYTYFAVDQR